MDGRALAGDLGIDKLMAVRGSWEDGCGMSLIVAYGNDDWPMA